jgi:hypothetical protein
MKIVVNKGLVVFVELRGWGTIASTLNLKMGLKGMHGKNTDSRIFYRSLIARGM